MSTGTTDRRSLPLPAILLILTALIGPFLRDHAPLKSQRPQADSKSTATAPAEHRIKARIWEDPLEAVQRAQAKRKQEAADAAPTDAENARDLLVDALKAAFPDSATKSNTATLDNGDLPSLPTHLPTNPLSIPLDLGPDEVLVLPVIVNSGVNFEDRERRIQRRYALLSALNVAGFHHADTEHLGLVTLTHTFQEFPPGAPGETELSSELRPVDFTLPDLAFEWLHRVSLPRPTPPGRAVKPSSHFASALVLWIPVDLIDAQASPLKNLDRLYETLKAEFTRVAAKEEQSSLGQVRVIGPPNSTTVSHMLTEIANYPAAVEDEHKHWEARRDRLDNAVAQSKDEAEKQKQTLDSITSKIEEQIARIGTQEPQLVQIETEMADLLRRQTNLREQRATTESAADLAINAIAVETSTQINRIETERALLEKQQDAVHKSVRDLSRKIEELVTEIKSTETTHEEIVTTFKAKSAQLQELLDATRTNYLNEIRQDRLEQKSVGRLTGGAAALKPANESAPQDSIATQDKRITQTKTLQDELKKLRDEHADIDKRMARLRQELTTTEALLNDNHSREMALVKNLDQNRTDLQKAQAARQAKAEELEAAADDKTRQLQEEHNQTNLRLANLRTQSDELAQSINQSRLDLAAQRVAEKEAQDLFDTIDARAKNAQSVADAAKTDVVQHTLVLDRVRGQAKDPAAAKFEIFSPYSTGVFGLLNLFGGDQEAIAATNINDLNQGPHFDVSTPAGLSAYLDYTENDLIGRRRGELQRYLGITFHRMIHMDDALFQTLFREFARRGVLPPPADPSDSASLDPDQLDASIVLVGEWDSDYGRSLSMAFNTEFLQFLARSYHLPIDDWPTNLHAIGYARGIDGVLTDTDETFAQTDSTESSNAQSIPTLWSSFDNDPLPVGRGQFDYLRRLVGRLQAIDRRERDQNRRGIRAIGVVGSDVFDKLLVLRALRSEFPDALFFTTDLSAIYNHPSELEWTRNLIGASSFNLTVREDWQQDVPPFRNSYQTALFATTLVATDTIPNFNIEGSAPRLWEIGHQGPVDLTPDPPVGPRRGLRPAGAGYHTINPHSPRDDNPAEGPRFSVIFTAAALAAFVLLLAAFGYDRALPETSNPLWVRITWICYTGVGLLGILWLTHHIIDSYEDGGGEPFALLSGTSSWPTFILRFATAGLTLFYLIRYFQSYRAEQRSIPCAFPLMDTPRKPMRSDSTPPISARRPWSWLRWEVVRQRSRAETSLREHWETYIQPRGRLISIALLGVAACAYFYFCHRLLTGPFGTPLRPVRGIGNQHVDQILLQISVPLLLFYCLLTAWQTHRCSNFVGGLYWQAGGLTQCRPWGRWHKGARIHAPESSAEPHFLNVELVARITENTSKLIIYPFVGLFLFILSRHQFFDAWPWSLQLSLLVGLTFLGLLLVALKLRFTSESVRKTALKQISRLIFNLNVRRDRARDTAAAEKIATQIELAQNMADRIRQTTQGAFAPIGSNPILIAALTPVGGWGSIAILETILAR